MANLTCVTLMFCVTISCSFVSLIYSCIVYFIWVEVVLCACASELAMWLVVQGLLAFSIVPCQIFTSL
jgi:hypothetical protein